MTASKLSKEAEKYAEVGRVAAFVITCDTATGEIDCGYFGPPEMRGPIVRQLADDFAKTTPPRRKARR